MLKGLKDAVEKCKKMHSKEMGSKFNFRSLARCGLLEDLDKDMFKEL